MTGVTAIPGALGQVLRDYCHVEWWETRELRDELSSPTLSQERRGLFQEFRMQLDDAISRGHITPDQFVAVTADDCESNAEVVDRLRKIRSEVFGD